jgi:DNA repair protein RecN (Recombination protein N)
MEEGAKMSKLTFTNLSMKNFATFENQTIDFANGFNGITGETGSGKSLILDAFQLLLGHRADKKLVRKGTEFSVIEGTFKIEDVSAKGFFDELGFPVDSESNNEVIVKRIIYATGKSKCFLNHLQCPLHVISHFSRKYIDLVGQFENQKLTTSDYQLKLVDIASDSMSYRDDYKSTYTEYRSLCATLQALEIDKGNLLQREDYLKYQVAEFEKLELNQEVELELIKEKNDILNHEENIKHMEQLKSLVSDGDNNILSLLNTASRLMNSNVGVVSEKDQECLENALTLVEDFSFAISTEESHENREERLDEILTELDLYQTLKRKYKTDTIGLISTYEKFRKELEDIENIDEKILTIKNNIVTNEKLLHDKATKLHGRRKKSSLLLSKQITEGLKSLNMKGATFKVDITNAQEYNENGLTQVSFIAETNPGEGYFKITDIASGGELSRILLTLRNIISGGDSISIFFFDEIDTGIGGETANLIANKLKDLSKLNQVLAITHLAQIAKLADELIHVDKKSLSTNKEVRTISFVSSPNKEEREVIIRQLAGI